MFLILPISRAFYLVGIGARHRPTTITPALGQPTTIATMMTSCRAPQLIFGCGGLGEEFVGEEAVAELLQTLKKAGIVRLDTAALYPPTHVGASQRLLGQVGASHLGFAIDTKVLISMKDFKGTLHPDKIAKSITESHESLQFRDGQHINVFYPHTPDVVTPLEEQAAGFDAQYRKGLFHKVHYSLPSAFRVE